MPYHDPIRQKLKSGGFTLVETLLGLAIFSIIALGLGGVLIGAVRLNRQGGSLHERYQTARFVMDSLALDLENAIPYVFPKPSTDRFTFEGNNERMVFLVPTERGIMRMEYFRGTFDLTKIKKTIVRHVKSVREIFEGPRISVKASHFLKRQVSLADILNQQEDAATTQVLSTGLREGSIKFQYGSIDRTDQAAPKISFKDQWKKDQLPDLVRIEASFYDEGTTASPVVVSRDVYLMIKDPAL